MRQMNTLAGNDPLVQPVLPWVGTVGLDQWSGSVATQGPYVMSALDALDGSSRKTKRHWTKRKGRPCANGLKSIGRYN
jgi:hypothetical protein